MPPKKSPLWAHFNRTTDKIATCRHCGKEIKTSGNTSNLKCHLESKHSNLVQVHSSAPRPTSDQNIANFRKPNNVVEPKPGSSKTPDVDMSSETESTEGVHSDPDEPVALSSAKKGSQFQTTIYQAFKNIESYKAGAITHEKVTQALLYMICKDCEPFNIVEHKGFIKLMKAVAPHYSLPSRNTVKRLINEKYDVLSHVMKQKLFNKNCTLTTDIWTDSQTRSFMSLTVHFLDDDNEEHQMFNGTLGVVLLEERHTGENLAHELRKLCNDWGIKDENIIAVVTDNGANAKKGAIDAFGSKKHIPCFARTLNLVVERALEHCAPASDIIGKVKSIVTWFKHSVPGSDELRKRTDKKLVQSVPTRWNSVFFMLERFLELRPHVNEILNVNPKAPVMVTAAELEELQEICEILRPLENATNEISGEHYLTSSLSIPVASIPRDELKSVEPKTQAGKLLLKDIFKEFDTRFGKIEQVHLLAMATILDPRFKKVYFKDVLALSRHINYINNIIKENVAQREKESVESNSSPDSEPADHSTKEKRKWLFSKHNKNVQTKWRKTDNQQTQEHSLHKELSLYLDAPAEKIQQNPIQFWNLMAPTYPNMANLAKLYLSTVATSVPSERLFSRVGQTLTQARNRLKGKLVDKLMFLHDIDDKLWSF